MFCKRAQINVGSNVAVFGLQQWSGLGYFNRLISFADFQFGV